MTPTDSNPVSGQTPGNIGGASASPDTPAGSEHAGGPATFPPSATETPATATAGIEFTAGTPPPPLHGIRVIDYSHFLAGPTSPAASRPWGRR